MKDWVHDIIVSIILIIVGIVVGAIIVYNSFNNDLQSLKKDLNVEYCIKDSLDYNCIKENLEKYKIKFSHIVLAQIKLESNHLKHRRALEDNNLIGMRVAAQRFTFAINSHDYGQFAKYETVKDCIMDIRAWQIQNAFYAVTDEQYFDILSKVYCKDEGYIEQVKKLIE